MATRHTQPIGHPVEDKDSYRPRLNPTTRSSASSSSSGPGRATAQHHSYTPDRRPIDSSSLSSESTTVPASQPHLQSYRQPVQNEVFAPSGLKGKERASTPVDNRTGMNDGEDRKYRSTWMIDEESGQMGADAWVERDRVILVLDPTLDSLGPLLYNPQYASTLLIIALSSPSAAFTQLAAQTPAERSTYPIVQLVDLQSISTGNPAHPLPSMLESAAKIATRWRASLSGTSTPRMSWMGSRTSSIDSITSARHLSPSVSNRSSLAPPSSYRRSSDLGSESSFDSRRMSAPATKSRPEPSSRKSSFFGLGKTSETKAPSPASPFDAVLHFIPPASEFPANRALQEMLQRSILLTSAVVPTLAKRSISGSKDIMIDSIPVSLVHVLPANPPAALPPVIENFVLSLLPSFQSQSERTLSGYVITESAWLHPAERNIMSGSDLILFGGAQVYPNQLPDGTVRVKPRAFIPFWPHQGPPMAVAQNPDFTRSDYSTLVPVAPAEKAPPSRRPQRSPPSSRPSTRHHRSGLSQVLLPSDLEDMASLHTPELDHAPSSASSQSHEAATPMTSTHGSEIGTPSLDETVVYKEAGRKSGFGSFVRRFGKKK